MKGGFPWKKGERMLIEEIGELTLQYDMNYIG
jgi:hypothetical protein